MGQLTLGSLFSGIGGLDLGLERAGMRVVWQVEIDPFASRVLAKHWPDVRRYRDVRECGAHNLERVDLVCGGFPCQPHSLAGKRGGSADERDLWGEFARIIRELRPGWVLAENVPGLLSSEAGRFFGRVLRDLAACGYDAEWDCIPAAAVGAPHLRYRTFIVAYTRRERGQFGREPGDMAGTDREAQGKEDQRQRGGDAPSNCGADVADAMRTELAFWQDKDGLRQFAATTGGSQWAVEPDVGRVASRVPSRVDRLRCLGNAVVPQVAQWVAERIIECDRNMQQVRSAENA